MQRPYTNRNRYRIDKDISPLRNFAECAAAMLACITILMLVTFL